MIVGIDNGLTGGLVALSDHPGPPIGMLAMPSVRHRNRNEINIRAVHLWLSEVTGGNLSRATYVIEEPNNSRNASTAYSVASSFHSLRGFFEAKMLYWERITPQAWQKVMLAGCAKGDTKPAALARCRKLWPNETWLRTPKCKTPDAGLCDAALIAEFARIKRL
jgi:hypothetical protein